MTGSSVHAGSFFLAPWGHGRPRRESGTPTARDGDRRPRARRFATRPSRTRDPIAPRDDTILDRRLRARPVTRPTARHVATRYDSRVLGERRSPETGVRCAERVRRTPTATRGRASHGASRAAPLPARACRTLLAGIGARASDFFASAFLLFEKKQSMRSCFDSLSLFQRKMDAV